MPFVTKLVSAPPQALSAAVIEPQGLNPVGAATVTETVPSAANIIGGTVIANAAAHAIAARSAVITGCGKGSRAQRASVRGHGVWPMAALGLAAAIALSPPANHPTQVVREAQVIRQCAWTFHVIICRWRDVDDPPAGEEPTTTPRTKFIAANPAAQRASSEISVNAATHFAWPADPGSAAAEVVNARPM